MIASHSRKDVVDVIDGFRPFELGHQRCITRTRLVQDVAGLLKIGCGLDETQRDIIHAPADAERKIGRVLGRQRAGRKHRARNVDSFMFAERAAIDHRRADLLAAYAVNPQLNVAVVKQERAARRDGPRQFICCRDLLAITSQVADDDAQRIAGFEIDRRMVLQFAGTDLRSGEVLHDRDLTVHGF
jgi:hypothetical protein